MNKRQKKKAKKQLRKYQELFLYLRNVAVFEIINRDAAAFGIDEVCKRSDRGDYSKLYEDITQDYYWRKWLKKHRHDRKTSRMVADYQKKKRKQV